MKAYSAIFIMAFASPALGVDSCLVGSWQADSADLVQLMGSRTGASANHVAGNVTLEVTSAGALSLLVDNFALITSMPDMPPVKVTVYGYSHGAVEAEGGTYNATAPDYSLVGAAEVLGQRMEISAAELSGGVWGQSSGTYSCNDDSVAFNAIVPGSIPRRWTRIR